MIPLSLLEVETITGGKCHHVPDPQVRITGPVVIDSRHVEPGALFAALAGERLDGHAFADVAVRAGAVAVLAARPVGVPAVVVDDVVAALGRLARAVVDRLAGAVVVGVTGSAGKTSTKDLLAQVLARRGETVAPVGSFNNEIGLPLTALRGRGTTRHLVLEMAARGVGHIAYLCDVAPPRIGVVLNVGTAHIGEFGSREGIAAAKGELVEALPADGLAVLNADDALVSAMADRTSARVVRFGTGPGTSPGTSAGTGPGTSPGTSPGTGPGTSRDGSSDGIGTGVGVDVRAEDVRLTSAGRATFTLVTPEGSAPVRLDLYGEHQVSNALAVACVARELGLGVEETAAALGEARALSRWRMEVTERPDGVTVVNDAFNANPDSMRAALRALTGMAHGRRTWAVLGMMAEQGAGSGEAHEAVGALAARLGVSRLVVVGPDGARIGAGAEREAPGAPPPIVVPDPDGATELLRREVRPGDIVLVKASRTVGLEVVAESLLEEETA